MNLNLFDSHSYLGFFKRYEGDRFFATKEALLAEMDHFGIAEALVCHTLSRELDPRAGNPLILDLCRDEPRLRPSWALAPPVQSLPFPLDELLDRMAEAGVRAVRFFPAHLEFPIEQWCLGPILEVLEEGRVPVFFDPTPTLRWVERDLTDWDALVRICKAYPNLPVIAAEGRWYWRTRTWYSALAACDNLILETSAFWGWKGIEFVCREFGAHHLVFGTRLPVGEAGLPVGTLQYAQVCDEDKLAIAGGNLRRLLAEALPQAAPCADAPEPERIVLPEPDVAQGRMYLAIRASENPFEGETLHDIHAHIGHGAPYFLPDSDTDHLVEQFRRWGFSKVVPFAFSGLMSDWTSGNDVAYAAMQAYPGLFFPLATVALWDVPEMVREMERCCDELGFYGVKLHPWWNGYPEAGENIRKCVEFVAERGLLLINHYWGPPSILDEFATDFPEAHLMTGHLTTDDGYAAVVNKHENVYVCTCLPVYRGDVRRAARKLNPDKIMFGSDAPDLPIPMGFAPFLYADIGDDIKRKIMGGNAERMLEQVIAARNKNIAR